MKPKLKKLKQMPILNQPVRRGMIGYHIRSGGHDLNEYDWQRFIDFADLHFNKATLN